MSIKNFLTRKQNFVALAHISNALGTINPIKKIIELAHNFDVPVLIDGAQGIPHKKNWCSGFRLWFLLFLQDIKVFCSDGFRCSLWKEKWLEKLPPYQFGGEMVENVTFEKTTFNELPFKFVSGNTKCWKHSRIRNCIKIYFRNRNRKYRKLWK